MSNIVEKKTRTRCEEHLAGKEEIPVVIRVRVSDTPTGVGFAWCGVDCDDLVLNRTA